MTGNILLLAAIAVSFILPFVYKPSVNAKSNKGLLLNIPNVFLVDLNLAGYPIRDIVNGIWGAGIQSYRWSWRRIISAILGICALLLLLSLFSPLAMRFALWILLGFAAGRFVLRRYTESLGLYHMLILIAQDRKDLKVPSKGDSTGCVAALMAFAILPLAILFLATSYFGAQTRVNTVLIYAVYPVCAVILGAAWGRFHAYVIEHDRNIYYRWIEDYVRKIMQQIEAANDTPQP